jgi:probable HAF family extracellular repeat protein
MNAQRITRLTRRGSARTVAAAASDMIQRKSRLRAFTSIELLVVVAIIAILLAGPVSTVSTAFATAILTPVGDLPGGIYNISNGVSADGSVVVGNSYDDSGGQAFRWTAAGGMVGLGRPPGDFYSYARAVNADGSVVVGGSDYAADDGSEIYRIQAFRWTAAGGMQGLGHLPGGGFQSVALGVSGDGSVTVGSSDSASGDQAFRWTSAGGMVGLGVLPGDLDSEAYGVSADGSMVVGTSRSMSGVHIFRWTSADGMVGLGNLPGGFIPSGFSADGSVVVGYEVQPDRYTAFYCSADGGVRALWEVLLSHGVDPAADGWSRLEFAKAVSADGNTIVGDGIRNGHQEAFVGHHPRADGAGAARRERRASRPPQAPRLIGGVQWVNALFDRSLDRRGGWRIVSTI